jgi:hypothetical protein
VRLTKQVVQIDVDAPSLEAAVEMENRHQTRASRSPDMTGALTAFREKRPTIVRRHMIGRPRSACSVGALTDPVGSKPETVDRPGF